MKLIRKYIENHYTEPITLSELAEIAGLNSTYFSFLFKRTFQVSVIEFVTMLRLTKAKQLLTKEIPIKEIAEQVGYNDEFYFSRIFKKYEGISPKAYMKQNYKRIGVVTGSMMGYLYPLQLVPISGPLNAKWTPYYYNEWLEDIKIPLKMTKHINYCLPQQIINLNLDVVVAPLQLPKDIVTQYKEYFSLCLVNQNYNCLDELLRISEIFDRKDEAIKWIQEYEQEKKEVCLTLNWHQTNVFVLRIYKQQLFAYCTTGINHLLFRDLGAVNCYGKSETYNEEISIEIFDQLNIDYLFVLLCPDDCSRSTWYKLKKLETIKKIKEIHMLSSDPWVEYSPVSLKRMLQNIKNMFLP